jgi:hypothetical protein
MNKTGFHLYGLHTAGKHRLLQQKFLTCGASVMSIIGKSSIPYGRAKSAAVELLPLTLDEAFLFLLKEALFLDLLPSIVFR